mmetsp:Transcript_27663/g.64321  ORF Transcript_27663/g.64321 Transcript_27663/m.64321 type:complete len:117 (-) Transcript_27663:334-684(-)
MTCEQWVDCACALDGDKCKCGESCKCGTITNEAIAEFKEKTCPWTNCTCGTPCKCQKSCNCGGDKTAKTEKQWVEAFKSVSAPSADINACACSCSAASASSCPCGDGCCGSSLVVM